VRSFFLLSGILPSGVMTTWLPLTEATLPASSATSTARESRATRSSRPVATKGASVMSSGTAWRCMLEPINARLASSCSRKGIRLAATETSCLGETSM
jgi:hypothetical protein